MSMTREEAKQILSDWNLCHYTPSKEAAEAVISAIDPLEIISALRGPTREMVERMFPGCEVCKGAKYVTGSVSAVAPYDDQHETETYAEGDFDFCPNCGRPLTDEAVEMVIERLEEMRNG